MKMVFIAYNGVLHAEIMEILEELGLKGYTRWNEVTGAGCSGGPHLGTHIWPVKNSALAVAAEDEDAARLMERIRSMRKTAGHRGVKAFLWPIEDAT